jgi:hypothetical protein
MRKKKELINRDLKIAKKFEERNKMVIYRLAREEIR